MSDSGQPVNPPRMLNQDPGRVRARRTDAGMTVAEVADAVGVNKSTVSRIETGDLDGTWDLLFKLADLYGCTVEDLEPEVRIRPKRAAA